MKICPECGKQNSDTQFCTGCGFDISEIETEEERINREQQEKQLELERKEREQREKELEIERKEREQREKELEIERKEREEKQKQIELDRKEREQKKKQLQLDREEKERKKRKLRLKIIGVLIIIILILCAVLYFQINDGNNNQIIPDLNSDNAVEQLIPFDDSPKLKTVDFNGLFRMDVNESSTFQEVPPDTAWYVSKQWNNDINNTGYAFDGYNEVIYWKNTNLSDVVSNLSTIYHNPKYEGDIVILEAFSKTSEPSYYDYLVGTQSDDNEVVLIMGSDLDLLKTYANSIVFE